MKLAVRIIVLLGCLTLLGMSAMAGGPLPMCPGSGCPHPVVCVCSGN